MSAAELLTRLEAQITQYDHIPGGQAEITMEDVVLALAQIKHKGAGLLLRVKYLDQQGFTQDLFVELAQKIVCGIAEDEKWKEHPGWRHHLIWDMCKLAMNEHCLPPLCPTCNGRRSHNVGALIVNCETCSGSGKRPKQGQQWKLHLTDQHWKHWAPHYKTILSELDKWEGIGIGGLAKRLRESA